MKSVILIGMPGAGKSTVGIVLAKMLGYGFIDADLVIQDTAGKLLHEIIEDIGPEGFNRLENMVNSRITQDKTVIAPGGSVVYGQEAMEHYKNIGKVVFLSLSLESLEERLGDLKERGVSLKEGQSLEGLYNERLPLYEKYADFTVVCDNKDLKSVAKEVYDFVKDSEK